MFVRGVLTVVLGLSTAFVALGSASYTTFSDMQNANPGLTFTPVGLDSYMGQTYFPTLDLGNGLTFSGAGGLSSITVSSNPGGGWPAGDILKAGSTGGQINITLPANTVAFGGSFGEVGGAILDITLSYDIGGNHITQVLPTSSSQPTVYFGVSDPAGLSNISIQTDYSFEQLALNDFSYGTAAEMQAEAPEPKTLVLSGVGLITLALIRRRGRSRGHSSTNVVQFE